MPSGWMCSWQTCHEASPPKAEPRHEHRGFVRLQWSGVGTPLRTLLLTALQAAMPLKLGAVVPAFWAHCKADMSPGLCLLSLWCSPG